MNITLIQEQLAHIELALETEDEFDVYGGTTRAPFEFQPTGVASWRVVVRESEVAGAAIRAFDIYARQRSTGREWVVLSGKIIVKPRTADIEGDKLSPVEYHVSVPVVDSVVDTQGMTIVTGIPGPQGPKGDKGEPGEGGMTEAERATLAGAAQRDADNTFTAANTFTGEVDMSGASVQPPSGWNVEGVTAEAIQAVAPIAWDETNVQFGTGSVLSKTESVVIGAGAKGEATMTTALGHGAKVFKDYSVAVGKNATCKNTATISIGYNSSTEGQRSVALGYDTGARAQYALVFGISAKSGLNAVNSVTIGQTYSDTNGENSCTTEGTGSITIGAGANTLNNGTTESSNSVTIGCKAENKGADSVVIGAQAKGIKGSVVMGTSATGADSTVCIGSKSEAKGASCVSVGLQAKAHSVYGVAFGSYAEAQGGCVSVVYNTKANKTHSVSLGLEAIAGQEKAVALGYKASVNDYGATVIRSTASDGTYTQLYFSGANTPLANTYHDGAPMLAYVTKDSAGNIVAAGTRSLIDLLTDNSTFQPASLDENGEWVMPKVFHPSDLDLPTEEPSEPEEYQPLPVYPIVEPEVDELRTPTQEI
ncbi:MAG: hypothetical protein IJZ39_12365 [Oscillospiraceae bacterium]|nr:hypothetical protein [Oscillospiraceae bacterium]